LLTQLLLRYTQSFQRTNLFFYVFDNFNIMWNRFFQKKYCFYKIDQFSKLFSHPHIIPIGLFIHIFSNCIFSRINTLPKFYIIIKLLNIVFSLVYLQLLFQAHFPLHISISNNLKKLDEMQIFNKILWFQQNRIFSVRSFGFVIYRTLKT